LRPPGNPRWPRAAHDLGGLPPTVLIYAGFDPLRDEAAAFGARLKSGSVPVVPLYFPDMIHGFITMGGAIPAARTAIKRIGMAVRTLNTL
jgi:acetyl esterase